MKEVLLRTRCRQNLRFVNFTTSFARLRQRNVPKYVLHVQIDWFSSFNQSHHCFCRRCSNLLISALQRDDASRDWTVYSAWCLCGTDSLPASQPIASKYLSMCYGQASYGWVPRDRKTSSLSLNCRQLFFLSLIPMTFSIPIFLYKLAGSIGYNQRNR